MKDENIVLAYPIVHASWKNTLVSLTSAVINSKHNIKALLAHNETLSDEIINAFNLLKKKYSLLEIEFIKIENSFIDFFIKNGYIGSIISLYPIYLAQRMPKYNKFIRIAAGTIVNTDLFEFYNTNLTGYYAAGVQNVIEPLESRDIDRLDYSDYINPLVVLYNTEKMRQDNFLEKVKISATKENNVNLKHTDILMCRALKDMWIKTDFKYCSMSVWATKLFDKETVFSKEYQNALKNPYIIVFSGTKPQFSNCKDPNRNIWWKYANKAPIKIEEIQSYKLSSTSAQNSFKYKWLLSRIYPYIKPYWFRILLGFAIAVPLGLLDGVTAFALKPYMDYVVGGKTFLWNFHGLEISITSLQMAFILPIGVILFAAIQGVLRYLNSYLAAWTSWKISNGVKFDLFHRLIYMHPQFFDDNSSGIIISRYMSDPVAASAGVVEQIKTITTSFFGALGLIAVMIYSSWKLAAIGVLVLCIAFLPVALIRKRIKEASNKGLVIGGKITTNINETYSGNKVMAAYGLQPRQEQYFRNQVTDSFNISMSLTKRTSWMSPLMYQIASFGIAAVLGVGTYLINIGQMTAGSFASFVTSLLLLYKPVKTLGNTLTGIQGIFVAMGRVFELFDLEPAIKDCENPKELKGLNKSIDFENVYFEYIPNNPVLKNLNLHINKNETLAIVGNSGGGKSTLVNLLPRFYDIKSGSIKFDGTDIREFSLDSLRQNISMVFQDNFLYSGTIKENIMMGNPNATSEELITAIQSAHLQDMIQELPEGLETKLGERGLTLSGGQRQRVAIARAMLRNAPIVILDEATSALDNESEAIVQRAMDNLMKDRTVFIIAHRLSTIKNADRIAVINEGELVELGTHEELMNIENGQYKALYEMQFKKQEVPTT